MAGKLTIAGLSVKEMGLHPQGDTHGRRADYPNIAPDNRAKVTADTTSPANMV